MCILLQDYKSLVCCVIVIIVVVVSVWREWIIEEDRFVGMHFTLGEPCGTEDREAKV